MDNVNETTSMKEIQWQLPLGRYQSMLTVIEMGSNHNDSLNLCLIRWQLCLRNECSCCKNGTLHILINILDFKGAPMDIPTLLDFTVRGLPARESLHAEFLARPGPVYIHFIQS